MTFYAALWGCSTNIGWSIETLTCHFIDFAFANKASQVQNLALSALILVNK